MSGDFSQDYPDSMQADFEAPEPWEPWETWLCLGSIALGITGLVILGVIVNLFLL
jgi:hypothetical protein